MEHLPTFLQLHCEYLTFLSILLQTTFENGTPFVSATTYKSLGIYNTWNAALANKPLKQHTLKVPILEGTNIGWFDGTALSYGTQS